YTRGSCCGSNSPASSCPARLSRSECCPGQQVIEFAQLDAFDEGSYLGPGVDERRALWVSGVTHGDLVLPDLGELDAGPLGVADAALAPPGSGELRGGHSI